MYRVLFFVAIALKILMFRDAVRRGVPSHWFWIIAFAPLGEVIYFFVYPFEDPRFRARRRRWWAGLKGGGLAGERSAYAAAPNVANELRLARALYDRGMYEEARLQLEALLRHDEAHREGLYYLGLTRMQLEDFAGAVPPLERLLSIRASYREHEVFYHLALCHFSLERFDECIAVLRRLDRLAPTGRTQVVLAEYLVKCGREREARELLVERRYTGGTEWQERADRLREELGAPPAAAASEG